MTSTNKAVFSLQEATHLLKGIVVPVQPNMLSNVQASYGSPDLMSEIIQQDPSLSLSVLKIASHPSFSQPPQFSIKGAIDLLGIQHISMMVNAIMLIMAKHEVFHRWVLEDYWESSKRVAECCELLTRQLNIPLVEEAYCAGILHHVGIPFLWQKYPDYFDQIRALNTQPLTNIENQLFNCDHATVGFYIAKGLHLKESICETIRFHDLCQDVLAKPKTTLEDTQVLLAVLKMAEYIAEENTQLMHHPELFEWDSIKPNVLTLLGLSDMDFEDLVDAIREREEL